MQKIRFFKFLLPIWTQGYVWGTIEKEEADKVLNDYGAGTFLIRFSERNSGTIAIAYKQTKTKCRHYLIKNSDTSGQGKSLPNFIRDSPSLLHFLRINDISPNERTVTTIDKYQALQNIGESKSSKKPESQTNNYDDNLYELDFGN